MKTLTQTVFCLFLVFLVSNASGQTSPCTSNTPHFVIDLSGNPAGTAFIAPVARQGLCCGATSPDACIMATITLDSNSSGIRFDIASGAVPPGALYYQIGCNSPTQVGEPICLNGPGPHILTFCKPGNNQNGYSITALPKLIVPDSVFVDVGCSVQIGTLGYFIDSTLKWKDLTSSDGRYLNYLDCTTGCDTVTVTPDYLAPGIIEYQVCGTLIDTVCQSVSSTMCKTVTVVIHNIRDSVEAEICSGDSYVLPDGSSADTSGLYVVRLASASGCDSTIFTTLIVHPSYLVEDQLTQCDSALVNGTWYYDSQVVIDSFTTGWGCDSVIQTTLILSKFEETFLTQTACDSAQVNGNWYYTSQTVKDVFNTVNGCDSIVYTELTVNHSKTSYLDELGCDSVLVHGKWYFSSKSIADSFSTQTGCDSLVYTNLVIHYSETTDNEVVTCDSAAINGKWYYASQIVVDRFSTMNGCDSTVTTDLTINYADSTFLEFTQCEDKFVQQQRSGTSSTSYHYFNTYLGCDSVVVTTLIVNYNDSVVEDLVGCDSLRFKGTLVDESTTFTEVLQNQIGCDSIHTTHVAIHSSFELFKNITSCEGNQVYLPDFRTVSVDGLYTSRLKTVQGCDSVVHTAVEFESTYYIPVPDTSKCLGDEIVITAGKGEDVVSYEWSTGEFGRRIGIRDLGAYTVLVTSANGCMSKDTIEVLNAHCPPCPVYTPTAFTIDNNLLNESFVPVSACDFLEYKFDIYNRWGEHIFTTNDPQFRWDGTYMNKPAQQDVYVWILFYVDTKSLAPIKQSGTVTLLR